MVDIMDVFRTILPLSSTLHSAIARQEIISAHAHDFSLDVVRMRSLMFRHIGMNRPRGKEEISEDTIMFRTSL